MTDDIGAYRLPAPRFCGLSAYAVIFATALFEKGRCCRNIAEKMQKPNVKLKYRPSRTVAGEGLLYYQVCCRHSVRLIASGYSVCERQWDEKHGCLRHVDAGVSGCDVSRAVGHEFGVLREMLGRDDVSADDVAREFVAYRDCCEFSVFSSGIIRGFVASGRYRSAEAHRSALNSFRSFMREGRVMVYQIDRDMVAAYQAFLMSRGVTMNTVSFYMRVLRSVYNKAVEMNLTPQRFPFRRVYTGIGKTAKRALDVAGLRRIRGLDLSGRPALEFARDMFMFSFYTRGMSFVDMAYLRKSDLRDGVLSYCRRKTGQQLWVKWEACMQEIVDRYSGRACGPWLLPVLGEGDDALCRRQYRTRQGSVNVLLKTVGEMAGSGMPLTMYVARHSWASIAHGQHVPLGVISEGMGHDSEATTRIYLASLEMSVVDEANSRVIGCL